MKKKIRIKGIKVDRLFTWIIFLFMPLSTYATSIEGFTVGDFTLILLLLILMTTITFKNIDLKKVISLPLFFYIIFILGHTLINIMFRNMGEVNLLSIIRYLLYIIVVMLGAKYFIHEEYATKIYVKLTIIFSIYLIIQYISFYIFGLILPSTFLGFSSVIPQVSMQEYLSKSYLLYRPSSVFIEPAHYAAYQIPALFLLINNDKNFTKNKLICSVVLTIGLVISGSSTAIIMLVLCWIKPVFRLIKRINLKSLKFFIVMIGLLIWIFSLSYTQRAIQRLSDGNTLLFSKGGAIHGRLGSFDRIFNDFTIVERILGLGFGYNTDYYLPSYGTLIVYMGYAGLLVFITIMIFTYISASKKGKELIIIVLVLFIGTNALFGISSVLYFALIYSEIGSGSKKGIEEVIDIKVGYK